MYEIYLDESNGSIREEDDDIPTEDINMNKEDASGKATDANGSEKLSDSDLDKSKSKSSSAKDEKEARDSKDAKEGKESKESKEGKDSKDTRSSKDSKSSKDKSSHSLTSSGSNNVWVSGLSSSTRAAALQTLFKKYGKVLSAKIITNPRIPGSRAHGFITMETAEQAEKCIQNLNKTELDGKTISVSKNRPSESSSSSRHKSSSSSSSKKEKPKDKDSKSKSDENKDPDKDKSKDDSKKSDDKSSHDDDKKKKEKSGDKDKEKEKDSHKEKEKDKSKGREKDKEKDKSKEKEKEKKKDDDKDQSKEKSDRDKDRTGEKEKAKEKERKEEKSKDDKDDDKKDESKDDKNKRDRSSKSRSRSRSPARKLLHRPIRRMGTGFLGRRLSTRGRSTSSRPNPVLLRRIETERAQRRRERDREIQETKRRRIELIRTQREVERKAQEERERLEREMVKLRIERERLEREKAEILRLEREKARLERERIEREREELRRKQFQLPHRIDDSPRGRSGINKRPYDSRGGDPRDIDLHWDDRKRMAAPSPVVSSGRASFNGAVASRMSDFDARHGHNSAPYDNKGASYRRIKMENPSSGGLRTEYDSRRESGRHGTSSGGHDRDDRRTVGPGGSGSGYYRDSARMTGSSRDRDRRGGGRDDWKSSHDSRRDRYLDKGISSMGTSYSTGASYSGGGGDWGSDRGSSSLSKLSYPAGPSVSESRSRGAGMGSSLMTGGGNQMGDLYNNSSSIPMSGIMSHGGMGATSGLTSDERPYLHSVRRF